MDTVDPKEYLHGAVTCVAVHGDIILTSQKTSIQPMMGWLSEQRNLHSFQIADKIVGKAAAMLFVKAGISSVYAEVLSFPAKEYLEAHGIPVTCRTLTERIINRTGTGICPMEAAVLDIDDAEEGYRALQETLAKLRQAKQ